MPRRKPDNVTEHRVTVGTWEREQLKALNEAKIIKDVGVGVGVAAVGVGGTFVAYKIGKSLYEWAEDGIGDEVLTFFGVPEDQAEAMAESNVLSENAPTVGNPLVKLFWKSLGL